MTHRLLGLLFAAALCLLGSAGSSAASPSVMAPQAAASRYTLANGLSLVVVPNRLAPVATLVTTYGVGSDDETMPGLAHAQEHMMFRGSQSVSASQFADIAARIGADYNAQTTNQYTRYYFTLPSQYLGVALRLEASRMNGLLDRGSEWSTERGAIEQEVQAQMSTPTFAIGERIRRLMFGDTPYANSALGTTQTFERMNVSDIQRFYKNWYHPNNTTIVVAGDVNADEVVRDVKELFNPLRAQRLPTRRKIKIRQLNGIKLNENLDVPIASAVLGYRMPGLRSPDYASSQVLLGMLNNGRAALADLAVSGKILGADVSGGAYPELGYAYISAGVRPGSDPQIAQADLDGAISYYLKSGVPDDLVQATKKRMLSRQAFEMASISGVAFAWADALAEGRQDPNEMFSDVAKVTTSDVNRVLRNYFDPQRRIALVVNARGAAKQEPQAEAASSSENVAMTPSFSEALPQWSRSYFRKPLDHPHVERNATTMSLPNGMTLIVRREVSSPTVFLEGSIKNNPTLHEPKGKDGVANVAEALMQWGTTTLDRKAYRAALDAIPASVRLGTSFGLSAAAGDFDRSLALLADGNSTRRFPSKAST